MRITLIGHSTFLIEVTGKKIITDPYFGTWGNPAYARVAPPAQPREGLQNVDIVLISHNHWDHTDGKFLRALPANVPVLTPKKVAWLTAVIGAQNPIGVEPWETRQFGEASIAVVPAVHGAITHGYVIAGEGKQVYFAGDTFFAPFMVEVGKRFKLDVALMPVTTYRIPMTMNETQAVRAVKDLQPAHVVPIHLGIRPRSFLLRTSQTPQGFIQKLRAAGLETEVTVLKEGESLSL
ncbi:MAG: MBL fold metallo-hydrolase [Anaerolineae bacterium]|nr:MBL fold metallo-hydrolase [Anaerolineae bacterium]